MRIRHNLIITITDFSALNASQKVWRKISGIREGYLILAETRSRWIANSAAVGCLVGGISF